MDGEVDPEDRSPFTLLLKRNMSIRIGPKSVLDIPVSFAPSKMHKYESVCAVVVKREDGLDWPSIPPSDSE